MWLEILKTLGVPLLAGIVAAFLTNYLGAYFSLARFRKEQWWLEKRSAYDSIIRKLAEIKSTNSAEMCAIEYGTDAPQRSKETTKTLSWSLEEVASVEGYIVSDKTSEAVQRVVGVLASGTLEDDRSIAAYHDQLKKEYNVAKEALKIVRAEAHRDLKVTD